MAVTTRGIVTPDGTEDWDLVVNLNAMADSIDDALDTIDTDLGNNFTAFAATRQIQTYRWANAAARTAQTGMSAGDMGVQLDTMVSYRYSTAWRYVPGQLIASGTLTALSSFNIDSLDLAEDYEITVTLPIASVANDLSLGLRASGTTDTTANYDIQRDQGVATTAAASSQLAQTSWPTPIGAARTDKTLVLRTIGLNKAERTIIHYEATAFDATANPLTVRGSLRHRATTSFNGVSFAVSTGSVTGRYEVRAR